MKRKLVAGICISLMLVMCACENTIPQLDGEAEGQIVNYAAELALKYDATYDNRLVDLSLYEEPSKETDTEKESEVITEEDTGMDPVEDKETVDISKDKGYHSSLDEFFDYEGIEILFSDAYFADSYPQGGIEDSFILDAKLGKKLLVMNFEVVNKTGAECEVDFIDRTTKIKVSLNGEKEIQILSTMLTNDLSTFCQKMQADESISVVLLAEVEEEKAFEVKHLDISLRNESRTAKILLK